MEDWTDLLDSLQAAFHGESVELKKDIARMFVPVVNLIKKGYETFEQQDEVYGKGVLTLNAILKEYEIMSVATEDKLEEVRGLIKVGVSICAHITSLHGPRTRLRCCLSKSGKSIPSVTSCGLRWWRRSINLVKLTEKVNAKAYFFISQLILLRTCSKRRRRTLKER